MQKNGSNLKVIFTPQSSSPFHGLFHYKCSLIGIWLIIDTVFSGKMFPSRGDLHVAPFTDEALYMEQINKVNFWYQDYFHGVNLGCLRDAAMKEYFRQPIVRTNFISIFNDYIGKSIIV